MNYYLVNTVNNLYLFFARSPIISAIALFLFGFLLSIWIKKIFLSFFNKIQFNNALESVGFNEFIQKFDRKLDTFKIIGFLIQFFVVLVFLMFSSEILQLHKLSDLLTKIILYYPNILISIAIFIISIYAINFSQKIVIGTKTSKTITYSRSLAKIIDVCIRILTILAILYQLQIVPQLIIIIFLGVVLTISLSVGTSVGSSTKNPISGLAKKISDIFKSF